MRKAFIALGVIVVVLLSALFIANQQPKYAGVSMPKSDYKQLQRSQREIKDFVQALDRFDYNKPKTMTAIENAGNVIIKDNSENLSSADAQALRDAFYGDQGILSRLCMPRKRVTTTLMVVWRHDSMISLIRL